MYRAFAFAAAVGGILIAGGNDGVRTAGNNVVISARMAARAGQDAGEAVFRGRGNCATCHARDARGTSLGPDLTDGEWLHGSGTLAEITEIVRDGVVKPKQFPAPMPAMGGARLRPAEIDAVARYVLNLNPPASPPAGER